MQNFDLSDVWRIRNPDLIQYTWSRGQSKSRIDLFLINDSLLNMVKEADIRFTAISDHNLIFLEIYNKSIERSRIVEVEHISSCKQRISTKA